MQASVVRSMSVRPDLNLEGLRQVVVWDPTNWVQVIIRGSQDPRLNISGDRGMVQRYRCYRKGDTLYVKLGGDLSHRIVDALTTSLTRKHIQIELMVDMLELVKAKGLVEVEIEDWPGTRPQIRLSSPAALWGTRFPIKKP
jgi:hypothetical protein